MLEQQGTPSPESAFTNTEVTDSNEKKTKIRIAAVGFVLFLVFVVGLFWLATTPEQTVGLTLAFIAGLSMIFLPCTLPMAFVIVPLTMGKNPKKGFLMAVFFGLGLTIMLSIYGIVVASLGKILGLTAATQVMLMVGGGAALLFGLSEIGLLHIKLPSYSGKFPDFIQKQGDYIKTFLLGLFLGNAGVGCPNPAFYVLLGYIASVGDLFNGWFLGFVHGAGRAVPLIFLAILGVLGVNATQGIAKKKESIEHYMGWTLVIIGVFILTFGLFGHDWFIVSGLHTQWEQIVYNLGGEQFGEIVLKHEHKLVEGREFLKYGNAFFLGLIAFTTVWFIRKRKPAKKQIIGLLIMFAVIVGIVGVSTGWSFTVGSGVTHEMVHEGGDDQAAHTMNLLSALDIEKLPFRTPGDRIGRLPYLMKDGVKEFRLEASEFRWEYEPGKFVHAWGYNGQIPGPEIRVNEDDRVRVIVKNSLSEPTTVHWHSLDVEWEADGVPNVTQDPIKPGDEYVYEFTARPGGETGTRFYHAHGQNHITAAQQLDMGLVGPLIIDPKEKQLVYDREYTLVLDEWNVLAGGVNPAVAHVHGAGEVGAVPDYNTFTINGRIFPYIDPIKVREGEKVLMRIINGGTTAFHPMHTHGHNFELVALDGNMLSPIAQQRRSTYTVHPGETADFLITANNPGAWLFHCHHVHHASAGMIMLIEYEGFEGVTENILEKVKAMQSLPATDHEHAPGASKDHEH